MLVAVPSEAVFRFYAELNDFLPPARRQRDIAYRFDGNPAVKDAIEALGVPHTEVDLVLADGEPVDLGHQLRDGARIAVYPVFETFDIAGTTLVRPEPLRDIRFVADVHLGTLARHLRLLGFDTLFDKDAGDEELAGISAAERRVLLTRDRGLLKRRIVTHGLFVRDDDPREQLVDVVRRLHLTRRMAPFTRCTVCNAPLEIVAKEDVADRLEPLTARYHHRFRRCTGCGRIYWPGSHHERLRALVDEVRSRTG